MSDATPEQGPCLFYLTFPERLVAAAAAAGLSGRGFECAVSERDDPRAANAVAIDHRVFADEPELAEGLARSMQELRPGEQPDQVHFLLRALRYVTASTLDETRELIEETARRHGASVRGSAGLGSND